MRKLRLRKSKWPAWIWPRGDSGLKSRSLEAWHGPFFHDKKVYAKRLLGFKLPQVWEIFVCLPRCDSRSRSPVSGSPQLLLSHLTGVLAAPYPTMSMYCLVLWSVLLVFPYAKHGLPYSPNFNFWKNWRKWLDNFGVEILSLTPHILNPNLRLHF